MVWMSWSNFSVSLVGLQPPCLALSSVAWSSATVSSHKVLWSCIVPIFHVLCAMVCMGSLGPVIINFVSRLEVYEVGSL